MNTMKKKPVFAIWLVLLVILVCAQGCVSADLFSKPDNPPQLDTSQPAPFKWVDVCNDRAAGVSLGKRYKATAPPLPGDGWEDITDRLDWRMFDLDGSPGEVMVAGHQREKDRHVEIFRKDADGRTSLFAVCPDIGRFAMAADVFAKNIMSGSLDDAGKFQIFTQEKGCDPNHDEGENYAGVDMDESYIYNHRQWRRLRANLVQNDDSKQTVFRIALQRASGSLKIANLRVFYQPMQKD